MDQRLIGLLYGALGCHAAAALQYVTLRFCCQRHAPCACRRRHCSNDAANHTDSAADECHHSRKRSTIETSARQRTASCEPVGQACHMTIVTGTRQPGNGK
jgi:hypothetical protein